MREFTKSDIFEKMNYNNTIYNGLQNAVKHIDNTNIANPQLGPLIDKLHRIYKESIIMDISKAINDYSLIVITMPMEFRFPASIPYLKTKRSGKECVIVDLSKYAQVRKDDNGKIIEFTCDLTKLYNYLVPAFLALKVLNGETVLSTETTKWLSYMWAKLFNRILTSQRIFVGSEERYEAFMYFAMKFFMRYYLETNPNIEENIAKEFIKGNKSKYIYMVEENMNQKGLDLYQDWTAFATSMFSNEITNIKSASSVDMNVDQYIRLYSNYMGRDGAYLALWSADYFFYCLFVSYNRAYILNDRAWDTILSENLKVMPRLINGLVKEI